MCMETYKIVKYININEIILNKCLSMLVHHYTTIVYLLNLFSAK
jgi:hypothetical protein